MSGGVGLPLMLQWVRERESVRIRKDSGVPPPWTADPVIANYRFCNVRREDDRVTIWIRENIRKPYAKHPHLWLMLCIARQINHPDTLHELIESTEGWPLDNFSPEFMAHVMNDRQARGLKVYTGAYMISAPPTKGADKQTYIAETVIGKLWTAREAFGRYLRQEPPFAPTLAGMHERLSAFNGWGPFMAYQAVVDMRFTPLLNGSADIETWWAAGPGTLRGLNRLNGRDKDYPLKQPQARSELRNLWHAVQTWGEVPMDATDVPNICCEFDKWMRVRNGEGKPRAGYVPATATPPQGTRPATPAGDGYEQAAPAAHQPNLAQKD